MEQNFTDEGDNTSYDSEDYYIPERLLTPLVILQSGVVGLLFYLIGNTYAINNDILSLVLQYVATPLSALLALYLGLKKAKQPANKKKLKLALKIVCIVIATFILLSIATFIFGLIIGYLLKGSSSGGGNPWL
ncbi:hypothetical protein [Dysgonomonas sp. BGC7]|uniref:hypothetical protein n=1 Tax=Dysgonomonas sp. BGC7 TaxID=1658008 RepID=UPI0006831D95|nr:hypothetical protein [Dysgonomonas sp. BGC7]MBD8389568.1 hypothetical protein [Dysgonomonas sp. BGC7]